MDNQVYVSPDSYILKLELNESTCTICSNIKWPIIQLQCNAKHTICNACWCRIANKNTQKGNCPFCKAQRIVGTVVFNGEITMNCGSTTNAPNDHQLTCETCIKTMFKNFTVLEKDLHKYA